MKTRMADPEAWHAQFEGLDFLRKMNKYHNELLMDNIEFFCQFLKDSVDNLRSGISKDALMFTTELFKNKDVMMK